MVRGKEGGRKGWWEVGADELSVEEIFIISFFSLVIFIMNMSST